MYFVVSHINYDFSLLVRSNSESSKQTECIEFFGIYTDENLSWNIHVDKVVK